MVKHRIKSKPVEATGSEPTSPVVSRWSTQELISMVRGQTAFVCEAGDTLIALPKLGLRTAKREYLRPPIGASNLKGAGRRCDGHAVHTS